MFQHAGGFVFDELAGCALERLLGLNEPMLLFVKPQGRCWMRFYLDAGLVFGGERTDEDAAEELAEEPAVDYGVRFGVTGDRIGLVRGEPAPRLRIEFSSGELVLETTDEHDLDAASRIFFVPR